MGAQHMEPAQMYLETSVFINADIRTTWSVLTDLERWPDWTASVHDIEVLDAGPMQPGTRAKLKVQGTPTSTWTVTDVSEYRSFAWVASLRGVTSVANHVIEPYGTGVVVRLSLEFSGLGAMLFRTMIRRTALANMEMEAAGLKARVEAVAAAIAA